MFKIAVPFVLAEAFSASAAETGNVLSVPVRRETVHPGERACFASKKTGNILGMGSVVEVSCGRAWVEVQEVYG